MKRLIVATQNRHKFLEMKESLKGIGWEVLPVFELEGAPNVVEDGLTLEENSLKKAKEVSVFSGYPSLADDTGLFVEALNGAPGIFAARFAGEICSYKDNIDKLLALLKEIPENKRGAIFRTVITVYFPTGEMLQTMGEVVGAITTKPRGIGGFGYDPVFLPDGFDEVFSEMNLEAKNRISHRGKAILKMRESLKRKKHQDP